MPVVLCRPKAKVCGFHPQDRGSTPRAGVVFGDVRDETRSVNQTIDDTWDANDDTARVCLLDKLMRRSVALEERWRKWIDICRLNCFFIKIFYESPSENWAVLIQCRLKYHRCMINCLTALILHSFFCRDIGLDGYINVNTSVALHWHGLILPVFRRLIE